MPFGVCGTRFTGFSQSGTFSGNVTKLSQDMTLTLKNRLIATCKLAVFFLIRIGSAVSVAVQEGVKTSGARCCSALRQRCRSPIHISPAFFPSLRSAPACRRHPLSHGCVSATMMVGQHHHQPATHRRTVSPTSLPSHSWRQLSAHGRPQHPRGAFWKVCPRSGRPSDASLTSRTPTSSA